jgi:hypothetical protein
MSFPNNSPIWSALYWFVNTPGLGGLAVSLIIVGCLSSFALALRWIGRGAGVGDQTIYAYPTSALHAHPTHREEKP